MGASESKLVFKQGIFKLSEENNIPADDPYWRGFWELPESVEDIFSLFSPADIRRTRDASLQNLETLILAVTSRLNVIRHTPSFPDPDLAPERDALNCVRVLTRILPYLYETDNLSDWEENFFWTARRRRNRKPQPSGEILFDDAQEGNDVPPKPREEEFEDAKPLGEELIDNLIDMLFLTGFTVPRSAAATSNVSYAIWTSGVGCKTSLGTSREFENNRCEILRLLLTLTGKAMYLSPTFLPAQGVRAITYMATCPDKQIVLSTLCSLLNTTIKHNSASWRLPYDHVVWKDSKQTLVVYSLHLLLVLLLYPVPEDGKGVTVKNYYRHYLGRLHRPEDFQFIADGMTKVLSQPMQSTASYLPGSQKTIKWAPEMIMLFWETIQCNKRFRSFIMESNRAHDFTVLMLFNAIDYKLDSTRQGIVRMCIFILQTMSVESSFGKSLNKRFEAQNTLPASIRIPNFRGSYADFMIISINTLITGSRGKLDAVYPALLAIINNVAAYAQNLSKMSCSKLLQLFATMSTPSFLLANESNHTLLRALLEAINTIVEHQYAKNANLVYAILRSRKRFDALRAFTLEGGQRELENAARRRKEILAGARSTSDATTPRTETQATPQLSRNNSITSNPDATEEETFTIGDSDDSDADDDGPTPSHSSISVHDSHAASIASSSAADDNVPTQLRGMSEKARGKMPAGAPSFSRQSSTNNLLSPTLSNTGRISFEATAEWLESWLPDLPLHTPLTLIKALSPKLPPSVSSNRTNSSHGDPRSPSAAPDIDHLSSRRPSLGDTTPPDPTLQSFLETLPSSSSHPLISPILTSPSPVRVHLFEWSALSLGWYMSVLWSLIFTCEMTIAPNSTTATTLTGSSNNAGPIGVWNGTSVKLFQVATEGKREGPSLSQPRGAVDAVGSRLVQGVQGLNLGGLMGRATSGGVVTLGSLDGNSSSRGTSPAPPSSRRVREV